MATAGPMARRSSSRNRAGAHGLAIRDGKLYLVTVKELFVADIQADGTLGPLTLLIGDLPDAGQHPNRTMAFGPDGMLYISVGSHLQRLQREQSRERDAAARHARRQDAARSSPPACATPSASPGTRAPASSGAWTTASTSSATRIQPEELNRIEQGKLYGWPHVCGRRRDQPAEHAAGRDHQGDSGRR